MKAAFFEEYGEVGVLQIGERPMPEISEDEALIRVRAAGINRLDLMMMAGLTPIKPLLPHIPGSEMAGEISQMGSRVKGFSLGQQVVVAPYLHDGTCFECRRGEETTCANGEILGLRRDGTHAEYVKVPGNSLVAMPEELSFEAAAAQTLTTITAWHMLVGKAGVRPGETVLVLSAGSGVGTAAIQIAKLWGAQVIATASQDATLQKAQALGADEIINYANEDFVQRVREITDKRGVDIVIEHVGAATWSKSLACVARNGRMVVCGATTGSDAPLNLSSLLSRQIMILGSYGGTKEDLKQVLRLIADGRIEAVIDQTFELSQAREAYQRLASRQQFGKIILTP